MTVKYTSDEVRDQLQDDLENTEQWHIRSVETSPSSTELAYGDLGEERATMEVIRGDSETDVYLHHRDYPTHADLMRDGDTQSEIPGQVALLEFPRYEVAVDAIQRLIDIENFDEVVAWAMENEHDGKAVKERINQFSSS